MKDENVIDWRSTGRRKARRALFLAYVDFKCAVCERTAIDPPKDAPSWFAELWPEEKRTLKYSLQANHITKDLTVNDVEFLEWLCAPCHKAKDSVTGIGETTRDERYF